MNKSIWVVEKGSYSDYRVIGVFSTQENAKRVADAVNLRNRYGEEAEVNEWPLDPAIEKMNQGLSRWHVYMAKSGDVVNHHEDDFCYGMDEEFMVDRFGTHVFAKVWATDGKHAIKIVNEKRIQALALETWSKQ